MKNFDYKQYALNYNNEKDFDRYLLLYKFQAFLDFRPNGGVTLELGCANGLMTDLVFPRVSSLDVVDASEEYLAFVEEKMKKKFKEKASSISYMRSFFEDFKPNKKYDTILLAGVLPALSEPQKFLKQCAGWLKPKGVIFITSHNALSLHRRIGKIMGNIKDEHELSERDIKLFNHHKVYDKALLKEEIEGAGLKVVKDGAVFLKPLPNSKMEDLSPELIHAFYEVGKQIDPSLLAELYAFAQK